ncbi:MAG: family 20 glycosylhydrolase [Clostridia bacterium]|nr:family 20 glycosylhydrolase [Clostridia bacterium]
MSFILDEKMLFSFPEKANNEALMEIFGNFTHGKFKNVNFSSKENVIVIGEGEAADIADAENVINATDKGVYIKGTNYTNLVHGFFLFLEGLSYDRKSDSYSFKQGTFRRSGEVSFRSIHFCIFPETELKFLRKSIRTAALSKFTHVVLEFWGMIKFDCLKELAWPIAYEKDEIRAIVKEANALGLEVIPMFNHLAHASGCREANGKHVVLDQNLSLDYMFNCYGWSWNFKNDEVLSLLRKVRAELIDVCGEGKYFHIGCDEEYICVHDIEKMDEVIDYMNGLSDELKKVGRRAIMWCDILCPNVGEFYEYAQKKLSKDILIVYYDYTRSLVDSFKRIDMFAESGFDFITGPWEGRENVKAAADKAKEYKLPGVMMTTWHSLFRNFGEIVYMGEQAYGGYDDLPVQIRRFHQAEVARRAFFSDGDYKIAGWSEKMTGPGLM